MDVKKSNLLADRFKLSSFSLKIYNVNAGNRRYASMSSVCNGAKTLQIANQKRGYIEKYVNIIYALGSAHVKFDVWIEVDLLPFHSTSSVEKNGRVDPNSKVPSLIDSYVELYMHRT